MVLNRAVGSWGSGKSYEGPSACALVEFVPELQSEKCTLLRSCGVGPKSAACFPDVFATVGEGQVERNKHLERLGERGLAVLYKWVG